MAFVFLIGELLLSGILPLIGAAARSDYKNGHFSGRSKQW
jgi:hypothetical protein